MGVRTTLPGMSTKDCVAEVRQAEHTLYMRSTLMSMERATATAMSARNRPMYSS